jgi:hypothetical protein
MATGVNMNKNRWIDGAHTFGLAGLTMLALSASGGAWADQDLIKQGEGDFNPWTQQYPLMPPKGYASLKFLEGAR